MKIRYALMLTALLPLMVACKANDGSADVTAATAPAATEAAPAAAEQAPTTAPADAPADTVVPAAETTAPASQAGPVVPPQGPAPVEGTDYQLIEGGVPFAPVAGKVEVVEIFGYICPACFRFQSILAPWKSRLPADVSFVYVPASFGGPWDDYARAFYAAKTLGVQEATHEPLYAAIHVNDQLKGERGRDSLADIAAFYASFGVNAQASRAKQFAQRSKISGTPSLVVDGKYLVKGKSFEDMLRITDHLIARERAAQGR
jgi:thiol:disulfide interchange protein DsbA